MSRRRKGRSTDHTSRIRSIRKGLRAHRLMKKHKTGRRAKKWARAHAKWSRRVDVKQNPIYKRGRRSRRASAWGEDNDGSRMFPHGTAARSKAYRKARRHGRDGYAGKSARAKKYVNPRRGKRSRRYLSKGGRRDSFPGWATMHARHRKEDRHGRWYGVKGTSARTRRKTGLNQVVRGNPKRGRKSRRYRPLAGYRGTRSALIRWAGRLESHGRAGGFSLRGSTYRGPALKSARARKRLRMRKNPTGAQHRRWQSQHKKAAMWIAKRSRMRRGNPQRRRNAPISARDKAALRHILKAHRGRRNNPGDNSYKGFTYALTPDPYNKRRFCLQIYKPNGHMLGGQFIALTQKDAHRTAKSSITNEIKDPDGDKAYYEDYQRRQTGYRNH